MNVVMAQRGYILVSEQTGKPRPDDFFESLADAERVLKLLLAHQPHRGPHRIVPAQRTVEIAE